MSHVAGRALTVVALAAAVATGCGEASEPTALSVPLLPGSPTSPDVSEPPPLHPDRVAAGEELYQAYCAQCHGLDLAGAPDWQVPNDDGSFKPPPQDGTGHTWHHADQLLLEIVSVGSNFPQSRMPAFGDQLSDDQIMAILDYFKSNWGRQERAFQWEQTVRARGGS